MQQLYPAWNSIFYRLFLCDDSRMKHDRSIRILHFGIVASILLQMFGQKLTGLPAEMFKLGKDEI